MLILDAATVAAAAEKTRELRAALGTLASELERVLAKVKNASSLWQPLFDVPDVVRILREFRWNRAVLSHKDGKAYVIFKGHAGKRTIFRGPRYLAKNISLQLMELGVGKLGRAASALKAMKLSVYIAVPFDVVLWILGDRHTVSRLFGTVTCDLLKAGLAMFAGLGAGALAAGLTTVVAAPIVATFFVGAAVGIVLDQVDSDRGLTELLVRQMEALETSAPGRAREILRMFGTYEYALKQMLTRRAIQAARQR